MVIFYKLLKNVWATPPANEKRLDQAFEGFARIRQTADHSHPRVSWSLPPTIDPSVFSAKSRENYHREQQKSRKHEVNKSGSPKVEGNLIPQPYEEYVAAVSNGRQINVHYISSS
ncbi:hypothetical protein MXB_2140 [Myxobolus squamalis]|nr:hypothetical protein MXB_2140 [Myxobolus squamalis]